MNGDVPQKRMRCSDSKTIQTNDGEEKEGEKMRNAGIKVKSRNMSAASFEKEKKRKNSDNRKNAKKMRIYVDEEDKERKDHHKVKDSKVFASLLNKEEEKRKKERLNEINSGKKMRIDGGKEKTMCGGQSKFKSCKVPTPNYEKEKKRVNKTSEKKTVHPDNYGKVEGMKMCSCDYKVKNGKMSATFSEKEKKKRPYKTKMPSEDDENEEKMRNDHGKVKSRKFSTTISEKEKKRKMLSSGNVEKQMNDKTIKSQPSFSNNMMQNNDIKKKTSSVITAGKVKKMKPSESKGMKMPYDGRQKKMGMSKGKEQHTLPKKEKIMQSNDNDKKTHGGKVNEKKICSDGKEKNNKAPFAFFKVLWNNFEEFLSIPPSVTAGLKDLTNHLVYLEDYEGKRSEIRLSMVDGSLAFHQGWSIFVSDHLIKWGELLVFQYTAKSTFSVRIFGRDSRERLQFNVERKRETSGNKLARNNRSPDNLVSFDRNSEDMDGDHHLSGEYPRGKEPERHHVTVLTKEDPKRVECGVGSGPVALDSNKGNFVNRQCKTKGVHPLCSKEKTFVLIDDSGHSTHENEDIVKLLRPDADSDPYLVADNTNGDPKSVRSGDGNGPSAIPDVKKGSLLDVGCRTKCTSLIFSKEKTKSLVDAVPLTNENDDRAKHKFEIQDPNEDLRRKQEKSIHTESTTALDRYHCNSKINISLNVCRIYDAPGGFRCLEKWRKGTVSSQPALHGTGFIKPENPVNNDSKLFGDYGAIELNPVNNCFSSDGTHAYFHAMPVKESSSKCKFGQTDIDDSIDGKSAFAQLQGKTEHLEPMGHIVNRPGNNVPVCANPVVACNYGIIGLKPVVSEDSCAFVESMPPAPFEKPSSPERIFKCGGSRTEIDHNVDRKGTTSQLETKMDQLEPVGNMEISERSNISVCANDVVARQSEHCFFELEERKSINCVTPGDTLPKSTNILELDDPSLLNINLQFCIPDTTRQWLELPKSLSSAVRVKRQERNVVMLKDPMKRLWPVFYHENSVFVGFTSGWKHFVAANNLQTGDLCDLSKEPDGEEPVYSVQITRK